TGIKATPDGGCIVVGYVHSDDGDVTSNRGASDYWVAKVDAAGAIQWQKNYGSWSWELPYSIMAARNGHFIITGRSETAGDDGDVVGTIGDADVWTICIDGSGNLVWTKILGGTEWDDGTWIAPTTDGGYILTGVANSEDVDAAANPFPFAAWMVKFGPDATTLPVDLVNFSGKHDAGVNILEWTTAFERNNAYFILERSTDGLSFQPIATITGKGESSVPVQYAYVDNKNISHHDKLFYRLKQVDIDGTATASRIITLQRPYVFTQINGWQHKPGSFTVEVKAEKALSLTINIRDATGRLLEQKRYDISAGRILLNVPLSRYAGGACFVEVINGNNRRIFKAVNQ
ncbi:MAG TPA: hypothetical protein VD996_13885, partial [Chitinophagaceae bacterium]|nr:hypothetical protein [Chitinophagaceae bacterium]